MLAWMLTATQSPAATIVWSGAGGDELWSNPANWTGGVLPTSDDDVVINVPGEVTVRMDASFTTVRSLQCEESLYIHGPFYLTAGASVINGSFGMLANQELNVAGATTTFTVNGPVTDFRGFWRATAGAAIVLPTARDMVTGGYYISQLSASGTGSAISLTNLTNLVVSLGPGLNFRAIVGGHIDLQGLRATEGGVYIEANGADSFVDLTSLSGLWSSGPSGMSTVAALDSGTIAIPNVTALDRVNLYISGSGNVPTAQLRSFTDGNLSLSSSTNEFVGLTNFLGSIWASDSRLDWTNVTVLDATKGDLRFTAHDNSVIDLSGVTNVVMDPSYRLYLTAQAGGRIDLSKLRQPSGPIVVETRLGVGLVDLSGFTGLWEGENSTVRVEDGGSVLIPNVTAMDKVSLDLKRGSFVPTEQLRSFTDGYISLYGRTNGFVGLTNFTGYFYVTDTRLDLTNFTALYATNNQMYFQAEQGSFIDLSRVTNVIGNGLNAFARGGSRIDLSGLRVVEGPLTVSAYDASTTSPDSAQSASTVISTLADSQAPSVSVLSMAMPLPRTNSPSTIVSFRSTPRMTIDGVVTVTSSR